MANTFSVSDLVAAKSLEILEGNIEAGRLFNNDIEQNFGKNPRTGDQVRVNRRQTVTPVSRASGAAVTKQNIVESTIPFNIQKELDSTVPIDSQELTLDIDPSELISPQRAMQFMNSNVSRVVSPVAIGMAEQLESDLLAEVDNVPGVYPSALSSSLPNNLSAFNAIARQLNVNKAPMLGRFGIVTPELYENMANLVNKVNESGNSDGLRQGVVGKISNFDIYMSQYFPQSIHTSGTIGTAVVNGALAVGATSIIMDGTDQATGTLKAGDTLTIAGYGNVVVAADATAVANAVTISIKEPLRSAVADNAAVSNYGVSGGTAVTYKTVGFFGVADCIGFASIAPIIQGAGVDSASINSNGYGINTNIYYDGDFKSTVLSMSSLVGFKMLDGRLGVRIVQQVA